MSPEQNLLTKWRSLPKDKQEQVEDFVEFLYLKTSSSKPPLGERLRKLRAKIVASGEPLLTPEEIEKEVASRRGGFQDNE
ncbi:hypothetical protein DSM106972_079820 [Dulcicalothrix desertica PCC 7102]|uniref:DUF2281 domain-containing protein n=1 Tax=Dulcicalothrix desertica PCC 7102 TaxID=232991 RepID=A0A3S1AD92_9CYAN|nr:hypothetical protein [Dulcicalothrix desertica]RUS98596.1 hypothetical protein DSM106972_079820 [Dulcicalothrix desertica PCC 7102]TWH43102.1 hypothetical protein CAL7102_06801 [Dulcicalothrix desertica PCC 7102]